MSHRLGAFALAAALAGSGAQAASISWSTGPAFNGPSGHLGILTNGTLVEAVDLAGSTGAPIVVDPGGLNISFTKVNSPYFDANFATNGAGNSDPGWALIVGTFEWRGGTNVVATSFLSGLTVGHQYQVQFFAGRNDGCCGRTHWFGDGAGNDSAPLGDQSYRSVVGVFTADAASQTITIGDSSRNPYLNAYVLRDLTAPPVPEPGTWALILAGLAGLGWVGRRRAT